MSYFTSKNNLALESSIGGGEFDLLNSYIAMTESFNSIGHGDIVTEGVTDVLKKAKDFVMRLINKVIDTLKKMKDNLFKKRKEAERVAKEIDRKNEILKKQHEDLDKKTDDLHDRGEKVSDMVASKNVTIKLLKIDLVEDYIVDIKQFLSDTMHLISDFFSAIRYSVTKETNDGEEKLRKVVDKYDDIEREMNKNVDKIGKNKDELIDIVSKDMELVERITYLSRTQSNLKHITDDISELISEVSKMKDTLHKGFDGVYVNFFDNNNKSYNERIEKDKKFNKYNFNGVNNENEVRYALSSTTKIINVLCSNIIKTAIMVDKATITSYTSVLDELNKI